MPTGPGIYDPETMEILRKTRARGVVLIVIGGNRGEGFSVTATADVTRQLPTMLRTVAASLEADIQKIPELNIT